MEDSLFPALRQAQKTAMAETLRKTNRLSEKYGLSLSEAQITGLIEARITSLVDTGRVETGEGILPKLIYAFCDSPYLFRDEYCQTLATLQDLFYAFRNELEDALADDELILAMQRLYNGPGQGSLEYLENATVSDLYRAWQGEEEGDYEDDD
ncbi:MAG TPA: DUF6323 family protein [Candidatus Limiplasma sp.]|nr:DUF6323 family protein [Candidatus Limiplasma sp.]